MSKSSSKSSNNAGGEIRRRLQRSKKRPAVAVVAVTQHLPSRRTGSAGKFSAVLQNGDREEVPATSVPLSLVHQYFKDRPSETLPQALKKSVAAHRKAAMAEPKGGEIGRNSRRRVSFRGPFFLLDKTSPLPELIGMVV
jgi:hypothetical protein